MKILNFRGHEKSIRHKEILSGNKIDTTNAFLDRSSPNLGGKIAPKSFLFTDPKISSLFGSISPLLSLAKLNQICPCTGITLREGRLYESFRKPQCRSFSGYRIFPDLSLGMPQAIGAVNRQPMFTARGTRRAFPASSELE